MNIRYPIYEGVYRILTKKSPMQPDKSGVYDGHIGRIRSQLYNHVKP